MAAYAVSGSNWIGFDTPQTLWMKIQAARKRGVGGLMVGWQLRRCLLCSAPACLLLPQLLGAAGVAGQWCVCEYVEGSTPGWATAAAS
jgi:hypothetical protein